MNEEAVEPQETAEPIEQIVEEAQAEQVVQEEPIQDEKPEKTMIPLSVAQKLREQKRELELELQWERQRNSQAVAQKPPEEDNSRFESATREDLSKSQDEAIRVIEERLWIKQNPEKYERVNQDLQQFLKQRPNLASAIGSASNRYEEAYTLMEALSAKEQQQIAKKSAPVAKKPAPNSPGGVPKAAALNEAVDVMTMSDTEFAAWRKSQKKRR